eukprot:gene7340-8160_t
MEEEASKDESENQTRSADEELQGKLSPLGHHDDDDDKKPDLKEQSGLETTDNTLAARENVSNSGEISQSYELRFSDDESKGEKIGSHDDDHAGSTESFEFANGSDQESWESLSGQDIAEAEAATIMHENSDSCQCQDCRQMVELSSVAHSARVLERSTHSEEQLPENVTKIEAEYGSKIYLVGTAHFSKASQDDVSQTIQTVCPDVVMVELCKSRVSIIQYDEETLLREAKDISIAKLKMASGVVGGVMQLLLLSMSAHLTKQLGMAPGGEFRTAVQEANKIPGCQVMLGDRPVQITLKRAMAALSFWQKLKMGWCLLTSRDPISKDDIEKFKKKDMLAEILAEMTGDFPTLTKVFVSERDLYMSQALAKAAKPVPVIDENGEVHKLEPSVVVGVVGLGHVEGIKENYGKEIDVNELMKVPKPSNSSTILKYSFKAILVAAISWSVYRFVKWAGVY